MEITSVNERVSKVIKHSNAYLANCNGASKEKIEDIYVKFAEMYKDDRNALAIFKAVKNYLLEKEDGRDAEKDIVFSCLNFYNSSSQKLLDQGENAWDNIVQESRDLMKEKVNGLILKSITKRSENLAALMREIMVAQISYLEIIGKGGEQNAKCS